VKQVVEFRGGEAVALRRRRRAARTFAGRRNHIDAHVDLSDSVDLREVLAFVVEVGTPRTLDKSPHNPAQRKSRH
jgi:hypothetical protein